MLNGDMIRRLAILVFVSLVGCAPPALSREPRVDDVVLVTETGEHPLKLEVAATPKEWEKGLMYRRSLEGIDGMLFLFDDDSPHAMWMKSTYIPLDILFLDDAGTVTTIHAGAKPHDLTPLPSNGPASGAIELAAGAAAKLHVAIGNHVRHPAFSR